MSERGHTQERRENKICRQIKGMKFLEDRWDDAVAAKLDAPELLRYRSNLLGSDLRITNFGGGNTSSKLDQVDPLDGETKKVLWVRVRAATSAASSVPASRRSIWTSCWRSKSLYRGVEFEDEMVDMYPLVTFANNPTAASIDTPLHGFLPFRMWTT